MYKAPDKQLVITSYYYLIRQMQLKMGRSEIKKRQHNSHYKYYNKINQYMIILKHFLTKFKIFYSTNILI